VENTQNLAQFEQRLIHAIKSNTPVLNTLPGIAEIDHKSTQFVAQQHELSILLNNLKSKAEKVIYNASQVRNVVAEEWLKQPAQHTVPWIRNQGRNVDEWLQEWRRLCVIVEDNK
jgi:hypothetical protein